MRNLANRVMLMMLSVACLAVPALAGTRVRVEAGTKLPVRIDRGISTKDYKQGHSFTPVRTISGTLMEDIVATDGEIALPVGTRIDIGVLECKRAGHVMGRSELRLGLYSVATPDGDLIPIDGYPTQVNRRKVDKEGTEHGKRSLIKDGAVDVTSVTVGAAAGFVVAGPIGGALGAGGGLLVAAMWTVIRRGPDINVPPGTVIEFVLGRPVSFAPSGEFIRGGGNALQLSSYQEHRWHRFDPIAIERATPSDDLLEMADRLYADPNGVLNELKEIRFSQRDSVDRTFGLYLQAMASYQKGNRSHDTLHMMRDAYRQAQSSPLQPAARQEMARNLVVMLRTIEPNWERDPILSDPQVQAALVEDMR